MDKNLLSKVFDRRHNKLRKDFYNYTTRVMSVYLIAYVLLFLVYLVTGA